MGPRRRLSTAGGAGTPANLLLVLSLSVLAIGRSTASERTTGLLVLRCPVTSRDDNLLDARSSLHCQRLRWSRPEAARKAAFGKIRAQRRRGESGRLPRAYGSRRLPAVNRGSRDGFGSRLRLWLAWRGSPRRCRPCFDQFGDPSVGTFGSICGSLYYSSFSAATWEAG